MIAIPRVVIAAPSSGHGKTAVAIGLLSALRSRGLVTAGFKIGPDPLDAGYLGVAAGRPGRNLDPGLVGDSRLAALFAHGAAGAELAVVEATMGLYDGLSGRTDVPSSAQVAESLKAPVVLVVDVAAMGQSVAAVVHGFRVYDELLWLGGVILNQVASDRHERVMREALDDIGVPVLGVLRHRELSGEALPSRGEGLVPVVHRSSALLRTVRRLGEVITGSVDLERVLALARSAPEFGVPAWSPTEAVGQWRTPGPVGLAVTAGAAPAANGEPARSGEFPMVSEPISPAGPWPAAGPVPADSVPAGPPPAGPRPLGPVPVGVSTGGRPMIAVTTGYGYPETAELLVAAGAEVIDVDPLRDETLPDGVRGLVVGGWLPESYLEELSANGSLNLSVARLAAAGYPIVAEGTGLPWLCREYDGRPMCGVIDAAGRPSDHLVIGYRDATVRSVSPVLPAGTRVVGYKQHRGLVSPRAGEQPAWSWPGGAPEGFVSVGLHASYLCLHWAVVPELAVRMVAAAAGGAGELGLAS
ncbi:cobyrinate a,c-diamide synthase [Rugosimonospora acidiphila]|uniref:Cobyrinate a,c-diamide synthase n=1 Tax=Rugosimonospora acidiphila TaxID=556531 RepID=A0ABP9RQ48_9ACTN